MPGVLRDVALERDELVIKVLVGVSIIVSFGQYERGGKTYPSESLDDVLGVLVWNCALRRTVDR